MVLSWATRFGNRSRDHTPLAASKGSRADVEVALNLSTIIVAIVLIVTIMLQSKTSAFGGGFGGDSGSISTTRRGFEKTLFQFTIGTAVVFVVLCALSGLVL